MPPYGTYVQMNTNEIRIESIELRGQIAAILSGVTPERPVSSSTPWLGQG